MIYTDLPRNDFSEVFRNVLGLTESRFVLRRDRQPPRLRLGNLISPPDRSPRHPPPRFLGHRVALPEREAGEDREPRAHGGGDRRGAGRLCTEQGRRDWEAMLLHRARELAPGGRLALFNFGIDEEGRYLGNTGGISMFDTFNALWEELRDEGSITSDEYVDTNFPQHYRTVEEFTRPFREPGQSRCTSAGLRLEHAETRVVRCPFEAHFEEHGDPARFAREYIPTLRSWSESTFASGLSADRPRGGTHGHPRPLLRPLRGEGPRGAARPRHGLRSLLPHRVEGPRLRESGMEAAPAMLRPLRRR